MEDVRRYADAVGASPSSIVQRATKLGGGAWPRWQAGKGSPTLKTVDAIRQYMDDNPPPAVDGEDAA